MEEKSQRSQLARFCRSGPLFPQRGLLALVLSVPFVACQAAGGAPVGEFDIVLIGGRVVDPYTGRDEVLNVGLRGGAIAAITSARIAGSEELDVSGLIVSPGFIDLHAHGQDLSSSELQVQDGVTTAIDMEAGVYPVESWYASRAGQSRNHYGASVGHIPARVSVVEGIDVGHPETSPLWGEVGKKTTWSHHALSDEEEDELLVRIERGLVEGGLGVGLGIQYTPGASRGEILHVFELAERVDAPLYVHTRYSGYASDKDGVAGVQEVLANAVTTGARLHIAHVTSTGLGNSDEILAMLLRASENGVDVSAEVYPYTAASTYLESAYFDEGWQERLGISWGDLEWIKTGDRITSDSFGPLRSEGGLVVIHMIPEEALNSSIVHPLVLIASDGFPFLTGKEHPRGAGTFARSLGVYVRERGLLSFMECIRKMSLFPAQRLEQIAPQMAKKGRLVVGADADIVAFDPATVVDAGTYDQPMQPSRGIVHVLVGGQLVVRNGALQDGVLPGMPVLGTGSR